MIFGLSATAWTAIGTLALAVATFVSLFFARRSIKQTQDQIKLGQQQIGHTQMAIELSQAQLAQTQSEIELSRREVEEAHRPVVVSLVDHGRQVTIANGEDVPVRPWIPRPGLLIIPVKNFGPGPALRAEVTIKYTPDDETAPLEVGIIATAIGVEELSPLEIEVPSIDAVPAFSLGIVYDDVAGKGWWTFTRWLPDLGRYENVAIEARDQPSL
jgi:hypothetical protein